MKLMSMKRFGFWHQLARNTNQPNWKDLSTTVLMIKRAITVLNRVTKSAIVTKYRKLLVKVHSAL